MKRARRALSWVISRAAQALFHSGKYQNSPHSHRFDLLNGRHRSLPAPLGILPRNVGPQRLSIKTEHLFSSLPLDGADFFNALIFCAKGLEKK